MSMKLLRETIKLVDSEDGLENVKVRRKPAKPSRNERERQQFAALASTSEYDPESDDITVASNTEKRKESGECNRKIAKNTSLLEWSRASRKKNLLKRNIRYMAYETGRNVIADKADKLLEFMSERDRRRRNILRKLHSRNDGLRGGKRKSKKSSNKSIFTDEDFMKVGVGRIKLLRGKNFKNAGV